ncbi:hypothetical protein DUI87_11799 [Hirundo rustica rustica]|uniref:Uncharacterized protein n=1 Tax=Hirundo rustica rustica TaxID=333673 RepID=A0A3M0KX39_HIRRU|nr:hypothetical protein DUI87_11799 [Hirundo rustica rustica]
MFTLGIMVQLPSVLMASFIPVQKRMKKAIQDADPYTSHSPRCSDGPSLPSLSSFPDAHQPCVSGTQSAPPPGHNSSIPLRHSENRHRWDPAHLHTFSSIIPASTEDGGKRSNVAMPGTPQPKPCVASTKAFPFAHSPAYFPEVTKPPANEWYPSASSGLNQTVKRSSMLVVVDIQLDITAKGHVMRTPVMLTLVTGGRLQMQEKFGNSIQIVDDGCLKSWNMGFEGMNGKQTRSFQQQGRYQHLHFTSGKTVSSKGERTQKVK